MEMLAGSHVTKDRNWSHETDYVRLDVQQVDPNLA